VAASGREDLEVVVVDDGSADGGAQAVRAWSGAHPDVALVALRHPVGAGLGAARTTALGEARGELAFVIDAGAEAYPAALERLVGALDAAGDEVAVAYPMIEVRDDGEPLGLRSTLAWDPRQLATRDLVEGPALWRTAALREIGGFTTDRRLHGLEDRDACLGLAERGLRGLAVAQVLARDRTERAATLPAAALSDRIARSVLAGRYPRTLGVG
jgi:glycosyltransferase involved in cell wall biosynthesis